MRRMLLELCSGYKVVKVLNFFPFCLASQRRSNKIKLSTSLDAEYSPSPKANFTADSTFTPFSVRMGAIYRPPAPGEAPTRSANGWTDFLYNAREVSSCLMHGMTSSVIAILNLFRRNLRRGTGYRKYVQYGYHFESMFIQHLYRELLALRLVS